MKIRNVLAGSSVVGASASIIFTDKHGGLPRIQTLVQTSTVTKVRVSSSVLTADTRFQPKEYSKLSHQLSPRNELVYLVMVDKGFILSQPLVQQKQSITVVLLKGVKLKN